MHTNHRNNHRNQTIPTDSRQRTAFNHAAKSENRVNRARIRQVIRKIEAGCIDPDAAVLPLGK
jgi:hypothetical protein